VSANMVVTVRILLFIKWINIPDFLKKGERKL